MLCRVGDCIVIHTVGFEINDVCCVAKQHHAIEHAGTELAPQKGTMTGTPAIIVGQYGKGRVLCISPHPESTPVLHELVRRGLFWAGDKK